MQMHHCNVHTTNILLTYLFFIIYYALLAVCAVITGVGALVAPARG